MISVTVAEALDRLKLTRLAHFTPSRNLWHIMAQGEIRSSKDLADNSPEAFSPTDHERFDQQPNKVCCSFEYPNGYYLYQAVRGDQYANYPGWVCLLLDPDLVLRPGTLFSPCNAARDRGKHLRAGGQGLLDCYASPSKVGAWPRSATHHPRAATDLQAEALVPGPIDLSHLRGIVVRAEDEALELYGVLMNAGFGPDRFSWIVSADFFDRDLLSWRLRSGQLIRETPWVPPINLKEI
jgi:hypothetical protein